MKNSLTIILILLSRLSFAQVGVPTQFDTFIYRPTIQWAAYAFDTIRFKDPNFSALLVNRVMRKEIKSACYLYSGSSYANNFKYATRDDLKQRLYPICSLPIYDSSGNLLAGYSETKEPPSGIDSLSNNLFYSTQIFYVENELLKCYVPWVSPAYSIKTFSGMFTALSQYFSTAINLNYHFKSPAKNKIIKLGRHNLRMKVDSIEKGNMLKELYGKNLVWALWPAVEKGKLKIYSTNSGERISPKELSEFIVSPTPWCNEVYNSDGVTIGKKFGNNEMIPFYITEVEIVQDWFYDYTSNKVICKIPEMLLYAGRDDSRNLYEPAKPVLKIVF